MKSWVTLLIVTILFSFTNAGFSQTNDEGLAFLQLNFLNPGARSLAMGGAFIGMADDATAALANPAGLPILIKPEISLEFASTDYTNEIPWTAGRQFFDQDLTRDFNFSREFLPQDFSERVNNVSFASFVYPVVKSRFVLAGFYNEQTKFRREFETASFDNCITGDPCVLGDPANGHFFATNNSLELTIRNFGVSTGFQLGQDLSFGITLSHSNLDITSNTLRVDARDRFPTTDRLNQESLAGDDSAFSFALGALINPGGKVSVGAVYTNRPEFNVASSYVAFLTPGSEITTDQILKIPDSFGFGITLRPSEAFSINFDINRILYSQLNDGYYNAFLSPVVDPNDPFFNDPDFGRDTFEVEDITEWRFGGEYVFTIGNNPFAVRAGYWREPFHSLVNNVDDANLVLLFDEFGNRINETGNEPWFSRSLTQDNNHFTIGTGFVFQRFSIDWAYDHSENFKRFVISTVLYLGR